MITGEPEHGEIVLSPRGHLDVEAVGRFRRHLEQACELEPQRVVVDFTDVTTCHESVLEPLVATAASLRERGCALVIRRPTPELRRLVEQLGLADELPFR
jgi:anti-anti-sigma factor